MLGTSVLYSIQAFIKSSVIAFWLDINNFIAHVQLVNSTIGIYFNFVELNEFFYNTFMLGSIPLVLFLDNKKIVKIEANTIYRFSNHQRRNGLIVMYSIIGLNIH